jgi:hypothetical protein
MEETKAEYNKRRNDNIKKTVLWLVAAGLFYWWFFVPEQKHVIHLYDKKEDVLKVITDTPDSVEVFGEVESYRYHLSGFSPFYAEFKFKNGRLICASHPPSNIIIR